MIERQRENTELLEQVRNAGQTIADLKFELKAELAAEALRGKLARRAADVTSGEITTFYRRNPSLFGTGVRVIDLIENQASAAAATAAVPGLGKERSLGGESLPEHIRREPWLMRTPEKVRVVEAIFAAHPGDVSVPMLLNGSWTVFVVRKVIAGKRTPLAKARAEVIARLGERRQQEIASSFDRSYTARWEARTSCSAGYIGPGCRQAAQPLGPYEDPFSAKGRLLVSEPLSRS
ncbi:MAG TPA: peptidylprolyl isomerase [Solirubrobacteraceae bacterium]|nr:peptidylprolyl isomerase [Solirubrobacteraceae bacterium]